MPSYWCCHQGKLIRKRFDLGAAIGACAAYMADPSVSFVEDPNRPGFWVDAQNELEIERREVDPPVEH